MAGDDKGGRGSASGVQQRIAGHSAISRSANDAAALDAMLGLGVRVARERIEICATLLANAEAALGSRQEALAVESVLDAEPLLFEAQTILNATTMLRRIVRDVETAKT